MTVRLGCSRQFGHLYEETSTANQHLISAHVLPSASTSPSATPWIYQAKLCFQLDKRDKRGPVYQKCLCSAYDVLLNASAHPRDCPNVAVQDVPSDQCPGSLHAGAEVFALQTTFSSTHRIGLLLVSLADDY